MKPAHAISLIQSAYRLDISTQSWLAEVAAAASRALGSDAGALAFQYDASSGARIESAMPALYKLAPEVARDIFSQDDVPVEYAQGMARVFASLRFASLRKVIEELGFGSFGEILDRHGIDDMVGVNGLDPTLRGCMLAIVDRRRDHSPRTVHLWHRLAAHVSAGNRLRTTLAKLASTEIDPTSHAEAVLAPSGKVEHAVGAAEPRTSREVLRNALVRIDAAREELDDASRSAELWQGLVAGRWSLVEHFERDGRRYYLAHKNDPELALDHALTQRECQVLGYAELGSSNKLIAYALGLSSSTVSSLLTSTRRKLGGAQADGRREMTPRHAISLIESAYRLDVPTEQWLEQLAASASEALESKQGAMAFQYDASGDWVHVGVLALHRLSPTFAQEFFSSDDPPEAARAMAEQFRLARFRPLRAVIGMVHLTDRLGATLDRHGIEEMACFNGLDPTGQGCMLVIADRSRTYPPRTLHLWHRLAAHVSAGNRLRVTLEKLARDSADPTNHAEAVLAPNGKIEHATGPAEPQSARDALRDALVRIDQARSVRDDAHQSVELWRGLVAGRWSLVEHFERDGRRYYLAHKNDPELAPDRALTQRELQVLGYAELGSSNKLIAYALGLSSSTVATALARARKKLGISGNKGDSA